MKRYEKDLSIESVELSGNGGKDKKPESKREYLTIDEVKRMVETPCPNELVKKAYLFSCFTGLRISDVRNLEWNDVSVDNGQTYISVVMQRQTHPFISRFQSKL